MTSAWPLWVGLIGIWWDGTGNLCYWGGARSLCGYYYGASNLAMLSIFLCHDNLQSNDPPSRILGISCELTCNIFEHVVVRNNNCKSHCNHVLWLDASVVVLKYPYQNFLSSIPYSSSGTLSHYLLLSTIFSYTLGVFKT